MRGKGKFVELLDSRDYMIASSQVRELVEEAKKEFPWAYAPLSGDSEFNTPMSAYFDAKGVWDWFEKWFGEGVSNVNELASQSYRAEGTTSVLSGTYAVCPSCGAMIPLGLAVCSRCGAVLNWSKMITASR